MNETTPNAPAPSPAPAKRRRRWPWLVLAVLLLLFALLAFAPAMFAGAAANMVASGFNEEREGKLEIGELDLAWTSRQALRDARLLDPQGREVAKVSAELPSLLDLASSGGTKIGKVVVRARAELVADDDGVTNLDRALAYKPGREKQPDGREDGEPTDLGGLLRELDLEVDVVVERVSFSDVTTRASGQPFVIEDLKLAVLAEPGQPLQISSDGKLAGAASGAIRARASVAELFKGAEVNPAARFEVDAELDSIPSALVDALARQDGVVAMALGPTFRVNAKGQGTLTQGALAMTIAGDDGRIEFTGDLVDGVLGAREPAKLTIELAPRDEALARVLAAKLPPDVKVEAVAPAQLKVSIADLRVEVAKVLDAANSGGDVAVAALAATKATLEVDAGSWRAGGAFLAEGGLVEAAGVSVRASLAPGPAATAARAQIGVARLGLAGSARAAAVDLTLDCPDAARAMAFAQTGELGETKVSAKMSELPPDLVVALAPGATEIAGKLTGGVAFDATLEALAEKPLNVIANVAVGEGASALRAKLDAAIVDPLGAKTERPEGALPEMSARLEVSDLSIVGVVLEGDTLETARELLGPSTTVEFSTTPAKGSVGLEDVQVGLKLAAARVDLDVGARLKDDVLTIGSERPLSLSVRPSAAMIDRYVGAKLPEGAKLAFASDAPQLKLSAKDVRAPLDAFMGEKPANEGETAEVPLGDLIRRTTAVVKVELPALRYEQPPLTAGGKSTPIELNSLAVDASLKADEQAEFAFSGQLAGAQPTELALSAKCADLGAFVDALGTEAGPQSSSALVVSGDIEGFPTALADALAAQDGLLVDVLGPQMHFEIAGSWPSAPDDPLRAKMTSANASVRVEAGLDGMVMRSRDDGVIDAKLPLSPLFSERIVGSLVPLAVNASKPAGAAPVTLSVRDFVLPLDGDLSKLDATVELDLGEISYDLLPGLTDKLSSLGLKSASQKTTKLDKLTLPIKDGVVRYDYLPVSIDGREFGFKGSFNLANKEFDLATEVPLEALGSKVSSELEKVRKYLDPKLKVPLQLKGTWSSPKLRISDDFTKNVIKKALEKAAEDALKGGLKDLLGGKKD